MKECTLCGAVLDDFVTECGYCGNSLSDSAQEPAVPQPHIEPQPQQQVQQPQSQPGYAPPQYSQPAQQQYGQPGYAPPQYSQPAPQQYGQPAPQQYGQPGYAPQQYGQSPLPLMYKDRDKVAAGVLGILLGGWGVHKFYLGKIGLGIVYLLFCWTLIPSIIGFIEGIIYLTMTDEAFREKHCRF